METVYGINPLLTLLSRPDCPLERVVIADGRTGPALQKIIAAARQKNIPLDYRSRTELDRLTGHTRHQGVAGLQKSFAYADLDDVVRNRHPSAAADLIVVLDGIVDPQNLGSVIRSAQGFGANGVVVPKDRAAGVTPAALKASAGSAGKLPVARVTNVVSALKDLKERGFWVYGTDVRQGQSLRQMDFSGPVVLIMGGESSGMRPLVKKQCDYLINIPTTGELESLNVSVAAGIVLFEIFIKHAIADA
ncbi:MAG TPA: 23S rRNA (guanosine(2251)-2'-O)-methyltransferase RlmB [Smithellaceae bacterium]|nr:23S rRNA (guanosine(2251)-2'-O)-methyltransferase RlmB [Smithellaceae bacterium]